MGEGSGPQVSRAMILKASPVHAIWGMGVWGLALGCSSGWKPKGTALCVVLTQGSNWLGESSSAPSSSRGRIISGMPHWVVRFTPTDGITTQSC